MKALINKTTQEFFKKPQKVKEDPESIMNNIQAKKIAQQVGIDSTQMNSLDWFFELVRKLKLPSDYKRQLNSSKDQVIYFNEKTHEQSFDHPSLFTIKIFFYETLANNKSVYTFLEKQRKLLPFVEEKMLRQCIGLNSKRRDAQKVNLQRDQSGKMVLSKLERITPDFKTLLATRSYLLKMLAEKVFTKKQIWGKGKRANAFVNEINQYRHQKKNLDPQKQDQQNLQQENLYLYQSIFNDAADYYELQYGDIDNIPARIIQSKQYMQSTPENILKNVFVLNISKGNIELYWLARLMDCLPMPPNWTKKQGRSFDSYIYQPEKLTFQMHPSYIYIMNQMNRFRIIFQSMGSIKQNYYLGMRQLNFYDYFERLYTVDMYGYIQKAQKSEGGSKKSKTKKIQTSSDWLIMQAIHNCEVRQPHLILIEDIQQFWCRLNFNDEPYCPSISPYGEVIWSSTVNNKSINFCPYKPLLSSMIQLEISRLPIIKIHDLKKQNQQIQEDLNQKEAKIKLTRQKQSFLTYYIKHDVIAMPWPYEIKKQLEFLDQNNYYEQIFTCPFQLDAGIIGENQKIPLWLQKCQAKNYSIEMINKLQFYPNSYNQIKEKIVHYAMDMVNIHEPHLSIDIEKKINRITNSDELIRFILHINDLDAREQRKTEYLKSQMVVKEDSDIFGSQISQVDVQEQNQFQSEEQVNQEAQIESIKTESEEVEKQLESQSQDQIPIIIVEEKQVIEQKKIQIPREQYEFLSNFPKNKYFKSRSLNNKNQQQLNLLLQNKIKTKIKKCHYKQSHIKDKVHNQLKEAAEIKKLSNHYENIIKKDIDQRIRQVKMNLITTNIHSKFIPIKNRQQFDIKFKNQKLVRKTQQHSQMTDFSAFQSECSKYQTQQIDDLIRQVKEEKNQKAKIRQQSRRVLSPTQNQQTQDTIQLQPIKQIKPDLTNDPVLKHIKSLSSEITQFRSTFNSKLNCKNKIQSFNQRQSQMLKAKSLKNLNNPEKNYYSSNTQDVKTQKKGLNKLPLQTRLSLEKKGSLSTFSSVQKVQSFHRVCLGNTASHFLEKEAFLKKGDLVTLEARKSLLSKGRGLQTFISRFY